MALNFGTDIFASRPVSATGYRSPESGQDEVSAFLLNAAQNTFETIYTVTTGKTFYVSSVIISNRAGNNAIVELGVSSSTVVEFFIPASDTRIITFTVPMKFASGTAIQGKTDQVASRNGYTLIGYEE